MPRRKSAEKELLWQQILNRQVDSGLSARQFCLTHSVSLQSFYAWRKRLRIPPDEGTTAKKTIIAPLNSRRLFVPLHVLDTTSRLEIIHPSGCRIQLTGEVDVMMLRRVMEALSASELTDGAV